MTSANNEKGQNDAALAVLYAKIARNAHDMGLRDEEALYLGKSHKMAINASAGMDKYSPLAQDLSQMAQHSSAHAANVLANHDLPISDQVREKVATELYGMREQKRQKVLDAAANRNDAYYSSHPREKQNLASLVQEYKFYNIETPAIGGPGFTPQGNNRHNKPIITDEKVAALSGSALEDAKALYTSAGGTKAYDAEAAPQQQIATAQPQESGKSASRNTPT